MPTQWVEPDDMESMAGTKLPPSEWMVVEQERINTFADCTEDISSSILTRRRPRRHRSVERLLTDFSRYRCSPN